MTSEKTPFPVISEYLGISEQEVHQIFYKRANKQGCIDLVKLVEALNDIKLMLPLTHQHLKSSLIIDNKSLLQGYSFNSLSYGDFQSILGKLIEKAKKNNEGNLSKNNSSLPLDTISHREFDNASNAFSTITDLPWPRHYKRNREKLDQMLKKHRGEYYMKFKDRELVPGSDRIGLEDYFMFLQECFSLDSVVLLEHLDDNESFFQSKDGYKKLFKIAESYINRGKEKSLNGQIMKNMPLTFNQCFDIIDFWIKTDHNVILMDEPERQVHASSIRSNLLVTIAKYEKLLAACQIDIEKQALENTLSGLYEKLQNHKNSDIQGEKRESQASLMKSHDIKEDKRLRALKEIFEHYCKKGLRIIKNYTFESIDKQSHGLNLEKFSIVLKDFKIKIDQFKLVELFKRIKQGLEYLSFEDFELLLKKVALEAELIAEVKEVKPDPLIMKSYKPDSYKHSPVIKKDKKDTGDKKESSQKDLIEVQEKIQKLWSHMGLYDDTYKKVIGGGALTEKHELLAENEFQKQGFKYKSIAGRTSGDIEKEMERRKEVRQETMKIKNIIKSRDMDSNHLPSLVQKSDRSSMNHKHKGHSCLGPEELGNMPIKNGLTLRKAGGLLERDIKEFDKNFHPSSLISQNDEEDDLYLAEYDIHKRSTPVSQFEEGRRGLFLYRIAPNRRRYSQIHEYKLHRNRDHNNSKADTSTQKRSITDLAGGSEAPSEIEIKKDESMMSKDAKDLIDKPQNKATLKQKRSISSGVVQRAYEIEEFVKRKQLRMIDHLLNLQAMMKERGMKAAWK